MIFTPENYTFILEDCLYALCVGFIVSFINEILKSVFYKNKTMIFIKDILICFIFYILIFSYVVSFANFSILRWYHMLFAIIGFMVSKFSFNRILRFIFNLGFINLYVFIKHFRKNIRINLKISKKTKTKAKKINNLALKKDDIILYND